MVGFISDRQRAHRAVHALADHLFTQAVARGMRERAVGKMVTSLPTLRSSERPDRRMRRIEGRRDRLTKAPARELT